jgi:hypothetical protein
MIPAARLGASTSLATTLGRVADWVEANGMLADVINALVA